MLQLPIRKLLPSLPAGAVVALAFVAFIGFTARAQDTGAARSPSAAQVDDILAAINRGHAIGQVAVSPDGKRLAWSQGNQIHVAPLDALDNNQRITVASASDQHCAEGDFDWSPDSASLAFFSDCAGPGQQSDLYLAHIDGGSPKRLTSLHGNADSPAFSPDGRTIAFLYVEGATRPAGALAAMKPPSGVIGEEGIEIQRVASISADTAQPSDATFATPANLHVFEFDWSPDSKSLAFIAADPPGENNWWIAKLYSGSIGGTPNAILAPAEVSGPLHGLQIAVPRWSPDGKSIAFIGGLMSDQGVTGGDLWAVSSTGGQPRDLTPNRPTSAQWFTWDGNDHILSNELSGGNCQLVRVAVHAPEMKRGEQGSEMHSASEPFFSVAGAVGSGRGERLSYTADRSLFIFVASSANRPAEIYEAKTNAAPMASSSGDFAGLTQLTHWNEGTKPSWGQTVSVSWTNDNFHIQGWLMEPVNYDPAKKYPLIVLVHGGPASAVLSRWGTGGQLSPAVFSELGYFVLQPNPRGSYGQGESFTEANRKDFGYGDLRDILAGVDTVLAHYSVDSNRIGLTGWSYGGFMTMFAVTQTHRFRAAVAGAGISDWLSYYGENSIDQWMIPYFGAPVYDDPQVYAKSSAIDYIKNVTTPTLSVVGDRDGECPAPQSFEFWHALHDLHVSSQLVVYPNEGHGFSDPAHRRDVLQRAVEWFAHYMPPA